jgi:2-polyprenyl-3-methyl-5-hydroxy-6-metoxy-1,4-benzoquinol methylase
VSDLHKQAEIASRTPAFMAPERSKPFGWDPGHFVEWATVAAMIASSGLAAGSRFLDVGCGVGWTSLFLAEAGFSVVGVDLVAANVEVARERARRWGSSARFTEGDMDALDLHDEQPFDAALLFDALHHSARQRDVLAGIARHLRPGGVLFVGEPTWLHRLSPNARRTQRELGWLERGLTLRELRRDLAAAGFADVQRFFQGTRPYRGTGGFAGQLARLVGARVLAAPQHHLWLSARRAG